MKMNQLKEHIQNHHNRINQQKSIKYANILLER